MEKIAIIADVHGNYEALKTVLIDIEKRGIKQIYCLGDVIGKGSRPNECLNLLKNCIMVYGNWEDFLIIRHMQPIYLKKDTNYLTNNFQRKIKTVQNGYFYGNVELIFLVDTAR